MPQSEDTTSDQMTAYLNWAANRRLEEAVRRLCDDPECFYCREGLPPDIGTSAWQRHQIQRRQRHQTADEAWQSRSRGQILKGASWGGGEPLWQIESPWLVLSEIAAPWVVGADVNVDDIVDAAPGHLMRLGSFGDILVAVDPGVPEGEVRFVGQRRMVSHDELMREMMTYPASPGTGRITGITAPEPPTANELADQAVHQVEAGPQLLPGLHDPRPEPRRVDRNASFEDFLKRSADIIDENTKEAG